MGVAMALHFFSRSSLYGFEWWTCMDLSVKSYMGLVCVNDLSDPYLTFLPSPCVSFRNLPMYTYACTKDWDWVGTRCCCWLPHVSCLVTGARRTMKARPTLVCSMSISLQFLGFILFDAWFVLLSGPLWDRLVCREGGCCSHQLARLRMISFSLYGMMNEFEWCWLCLSVGVVLELCMYVFALHLSLIYVIMRGLF